ncbi:MAG: hypothetical protein Q8K72_03460 [Acidimicrobiales bacterium]|nr:hypothetical protein [Acidimicrobiales bacterium]
MPEPSTHDSDGACPVCDGQPRILVAIRHPGMRHLTGDLLAREYHCWVASDLAADEPLADALARVHPDLVVVDAADFPGCCLATLGGFPRARVVVIGPEPDPGYRAQAMANGAGAWIPRERVGEDLGPAMRSILGCVHDPCPPRLAKALAGSAGPGSATRRR